MIPLRDFLFHTAKRSRFTANAMARRRINKGAGAVMDSAGALIMVN